MSFMNFKISTPNLISNLFNPDAKKVNKIYKEYNKLVLLNEKIDKIQSCDSDNLEKHSEEVETQRKMLKNNLKTLGHLYGSLGYPKKDSIQNKTYFNIAGNKPKIFYLEEGLELEFIHTPTNSKINTIEINNFEIMSSEIEDILLELEFLKLNDKKISQKILTVIEKKAIDKIMSKIIDYFKFKKNKEIIINFILFDGENKDKKIDIDIANKENIYKIVERYVFSKRFYGKVFFNKKITNKNLAILDLNGTLILNPKMNYEYLFHNFEQDKCDFIILNKENKGKK